MTKKLLCLALGTIFMLGAAAAPAWARVKEGDPVPEITVNMMDGSPVELVKLAKEHKKMLITFIQTACSACRGEIVMLQGLYNKDAKVFVLPISVDMRGGVDFLESYKKENAITFDFGLDPKFTIPRQFGMSFTPGTILVEDGKVAKIFRGYDDDIKADLEDLFK
jgi:peroxiredoxin